MTGTRDGAPAVRVGYLLSIPLLFAGLAGCTTTGSEQAEINSTTKFSSAEMGVPAAPRVTTAKTVRPGGGRYHVGKPYKVAGKWYHPKVNPDYDKVGTASWYGPNFHGRLTANGEIYNEYMLTAAHPTLPLPCYARVTNEKTGDSVIVRVNDRGPFAKGRIIDVSSEAAALLHMKKKGTAKVRVRFVGMAPIDGDDASYLVASYRPGDGAPAVNSDTGRADTLLAMNTAPQAGLPGVTLEAGQLPIPTQPNRRRAVGTAIPATATALAAEPAQSPAEAGIERVLIPKVVPVPSARPTLAAAAGSEPSHSEIAATAVAYTSTSADADQASAVFGHVLAQNELTPDAIVRAWNNGFIARN